MASANSIVRINVGGTWYTTTKTTLLAGHGTIFKKMLHEKPAQASPDDTKGYYFIDRDGNLFKYILNFLRAGSINLPSDFKEYDQLLEEAKFYRLDALVNILKSNSASKDKGAGKNYIVIEVIETSHPEKIGVCSARIILTEELQEREPFCHVIERLGNYPEMYAGSCGRFWIRTNISRLEWAELLKAHGWGFMGTTSFTRKLKDITGEGTDLTHVVEKWCLEEQL